MRRSLVYLAVGFLVLGALGLSGLTFLFSWKVKPALESGRRVQESFFSLYREDVAYLHKVSLFADPLLLKKRDASSSLNARVYWFPRTPQTPGKTAPLVPMSVREELLRMKNTWINQASKSKRMTADLSLFSDIDQFDHWDIESGPSPIRHLAEKAEFVPPPRLPIPEAGDLIAAAKLRLMKATLGVSLHGLGRSDRKSSNQELLAALADTRQLARLLLTTENQQLVLAGLAILDHERLAYRHYVDEFGLAPELWQPINRNTTRRANRAIQGTRGYLRLWTKPDILNQVFLGSSIPPGFCSAVNDSFPLENSLRGLLEPHWPFEMDFSDEYERLDQIFTKALEHCRIRYLRSLTKAGRFATSYPGPFLLNRLPYSRKVFGMRLDTISVGGFDSYAQSTQGPQRSSDTLDTSSGSTVGASAE
jgi:hypothetical protein